MNNAGKMQKVIGELDVCAENNDCIYNAITKVVFQEDLQVYSL